jgi:hypothetical protein
MVRTTTRSLSGAVILVAGGEFGMTVIDLALANKSVGWRLKKWLQNVLMLPQAIDLCRASRQ